MKIIIDSLVPNHRKKQLIPDSTIEPPAGRSTSKTCQVRHVSSRLWWRSNIQQRKGLQSRWHHTQHAEPPYFVHEEGRDDVSRQNSKRPQEVDKIDPVCTVVIVECHLTARLVVVEGGVDHSRVCQLKIIDIYKCVSERIFIQTVVKGCIFLITELYQLCYRYEWK